jgi:ribosomal protein L9
MQVILLEKVVNLGGLGDVVKVKDGFAAISPASGQGAARDA